MQTKEPWVARLKAHAKAKGISNEEIAAHLDVTAGQVSHWFTGRRDIWMSQYLELCRFVLADPAKILAAPDMVSNSEIAAGQQKILGLLDKIVTSRPETNPDHKVLMKRLRKARASRKKPQKVK